MNGCYFAKLALDDRVWTERFVGEEYMHYLDLCLYKSSSGNLTTLLPEEQTQDFMLLQGLIQGFDIDIESLNITDQEPPSMKFYHDEVLEKLKNYEVTDFSNSPSDSPEKQILEANKIVYCTNNEFEVNPAKCSLSPISKLTDSMTFRNTEEYCLVPSTFKFKTIDQR
jgi:hypothetical protein